MTQNFIFQWKLKYIRCNNSINTWLIAYNWSVSIVPSDGATQVRWKSACWCLERHLWLFVNLNTFHRPGSRIIYFHENSWVGHLKYMMKAGTSSRTWTTPNCSMKSTRYFPQTKLVCFVLPKKVSLGPNHIGHDRDLGSGLCPSHPRFLKIKSEKGLERPTISVLVWALFSSLHLIIHITPYQMLSTEDFNQEDVWKQKLCMH